MNGSRELFASCRPWVWSYHAHLDAIGRNAGDVVFIGDNAECDYFGPREAGIESYLIAARPVSGVSELHRLTHLYQLIERLH